MPTYLTHAEHGTHIAYNAIELEACLKNGWQLKKETEKPKEVTIPLKKAGRPPKAKE